MAEDFLKQMAESSAARAEAANEVLASQLDRPLFPLQLNGFDLIAEIKNTSPSEGELNMAGRSRKDSAIAYAGAGAAAISVLTEPSRFSGELSHLDEVAHVAAGYQVPVMRKDFLVSALQVMEARASGASGVLLIVAMLTDAQLGNLLACAWEHSMFVLLESFDQTDLDRTHKLLQSEHVQEQVAANRLLVGVNTRNLRTLKVDNNRLANLASFLPKEAVCVAESGLRLPEDATAAKRRGYSAALVGSALMRSGDPAKLISDMLAAGRSAA